VPALPPEAAELVYCIGAAGLGVTREHRGRITSSDLPVGTSEFFPGKIAARVPPGDGFIAEGISASVSFAAVQADVARWQQRDGCAVCLRFWIVQPAV